jgi:MarR family transcriptional regulator, lower aerobic nicotinate degradation pathway regulator
MIGEQDCDHGSRAPQRLRGTTFWLLGRAARQAEQVTQERLFAAGLRRGFYGVLATLEEFGPAAQAEMGRRLGIDPSDMVAILNDLERAGYVSRERDPDDRRRNSVTMTAAGREALDRFDEAIAAAQDALLASFSPADREQFVALLERVLQ